MPIFVCPIDQNKLLTKSKDELHCPACGRAYKQIDRIWRFLTAEQLPSYQQFITQYETIRQAEGRGHNESAWYQSLPYPPQDDPMAEMWQQRAKSYEHLLRFVVEPQETAALHRTPSNNEPAENRFSTQLDILDLGAGNGWLSNRLTARGHQVTAIDLTVNDFDGLACASHYANPFTAVQATFDQLPFNIETVDLAIFNASSHYTTSYSDLFSHIWPLIRPQGKLVVVDTPLYRRQSSGQKMVTEREAHFIKQYRFPSNALASENFLTYGRVLQLANQLQTRYRYHHLIPTWHRFARRLKTTLRGKRESAQFPLIVWEKA